MNLRFSLKTLIILVDGTSSVTQEESGFRANHSGSESRSDIHSRIMSTSSSRERMAQRRYDHLLRVPTISVDHSPGPNYHGQLSVDHGPITSISQTPSRQISRTISKISARNYADAVAEPMSRQISVLSKINPDDFKRPLSRLDVLYAGSLSHVPEFIESDRNFDLYRQLTTTLPKVVMVEEDTGEIVDVEESPCKWIPTAVKDIFKQVNLYKDQTNRPKH